MTRICSCFLEIFAVKRNQTCKVCHCDLILLCIVCFICVPLMFHVIFFSQKQRGSGEEANFYCFFFFAIFSRDDHLGFSSFTTLKACSLAMLSVNFDNTVNI